MRSLVAPVVFLQGKKYSGTKTTEKENLWRLEQMALQGTNLEHLPATQAIPSRNGRTDSIIKYQFCQK